MSSAGVLVTGANGFLGSHLLARLQNSGVHNIRALVRANDSAAARDRLALACRQHQLKLNLEAVEVVPADLAQPGLGLQAGERDHLLEGVDTVLHGGAAVNFYCSADLVQRTNVGGTAQLLELAATSGLRRFVQLSSLAVCNGFIWPDLQPVPEQPISAEPSLPFSPYARSKLAAEQRCLLASGGGVEISVLRIPYLLASRGTLSLNRSGYLDLVLRAALRLGSSFDDSFSLHALPVDLCADWVVRLALVEAPIAEVVQLVVNPPLRWCDWLAAAAAAGKPLPLESMNLWFRRLRQVAAAEGDLDLLAAYAFLSLEPSHRRWMHLASHRLPFANNNLRAAVSEAALPLELSLEYRIAVLRRLGSRCGVDA